MEAPESSRGSSHTRETRLGASRSQEKGGGDIKQRTIHVFHDPGTFPRAGESRNQKEVCCFFSGSKKGLIKRGKCLVILWLSRKRYLLGSGWKTWPGHSSESEKPGIWSAAFTLPSTLHLAIWATGNKAIAFKEIPHVFLCSQYGFRLHSRNRSTGDIIPLFVKCVLALIFLRQLLWRGPSKTGRWTTDEPSNMYSCLNS